MTSKTDLRAYFKRKAAEAEGPVAKKQITNPEIIIPATKKVNKTETEMVKDEVEKSTARKTHYSNIPKHI